MVVSAVDPKTSTDALNRIGSQVPLFTTDSDADIAAMRAVKAAFDDAITAREDKQRIENEAQAYAIKQEPEAKGAADQRGRPKVKCTEDEESADGDRGQGRDRC